MIYTPPAFSDHIAVSLLLSDETVPRPSPEVGKAVVLRNDKATMSAMPYKKQRRLQDMFATGAAPRVASSSRSAAAAGGASGGNSREDRDLKRALELSNQDVSGRANSRSSGISGATSKQQPQQQQRWQQPAAKKPKLKKGQRGIASFFGVPKT